MLICLQKSNRLWSAFSSHAARSELTNALRCICSYLCFGRRQFHPSYVLLIKFNFLLTACIVFYIPQFFQTVRGFSAINAGLMLLPLLVVQVVVSFFSGLLVQKSGHTKPSIICGEYSVVWYLLRLNRPGRLRIMEYRKW